MSESWNAREEDDLMRAWQADVRGVPDLDRLAGEFASRVGRFDRAIRWRNVREYAGGGLVFVGSAYGAWRGSGPAAAMLVGVSFMMVYLWWAHRRLPSIDTAADANSYRAALRARVDRQIDLLGSVRYWYLLPLYLPLLWNTANEWPRHPWGAGLTLLVVTAVFGGIGWLNERWGVARLTAMRDQIDPPVAADDDDA